eukprot:3807317-Rhodomonas_salina.1
MFFIASGGVVGKPALDAPTPPACYERILSFSTCRRLGSALRTWPHSRSLGVGSTTLFCSYPPPPAPPPNKGRQTAPPLEKGHQTAA